MAKKALVASLLLSGFAGSDAIKVTGAAPGSPISKVVVLLKDLRDKIEKDGDLDEKDYEKYKCWCKQVQQSKAELIEEQTRTIKTLTTEIVEGEALDEKLEEDIDETVEEEHENEEASDEGSHDRAEDNAERQDEKAHNTKNMVDLKSASGALSGAAQKGDTTAGGYTAKSDTIMGMISDQAETVQEEEETESKIEAKAQANFDGWITDMKAELGLLKTQEKKERTEEAETDQEIAEDTEMKEDTEEQRRADAQFLREAEQSCADRDVEFTERTKLRAQELAGVNKALEILDEKRALFDKTFTEVEGAPAFLQTRNSHSASHSTSSATALGLSAYSALKNMVRKTHSRRLAALAVEVHMAAPEAFGGVVKAIDDMFVTLKEEAKSDKAKKNHCTKEYQTINKKVNNYEFLIQKNSATIDKIDAHLEELTADFTKAEEEVRQINVELKEMKDLRLEQHDTFKKDKADDQLAIDTIKGTMDALAAYYDEHTDGVDLIQADPSKMSKKRRKLKNKEHQYTLTDEAEQKGASSGVMALMDRIITNLKDEIADAQKMEADNQLTYEKDSGLLNVSKDKLLQKMTSIENMKATNSAEKSETENTKGSNKDELEGQNDYKASIKEECDWILAKFDERSAKRDAETDGLVRAKELLSGASFVQQGRSKKPAPAPGSLTDYLLGR